VPDGNSCWECDSCNKSAAFMLENEPA